MVLIARPLSDGPARGGFSWLNTFKAVIVRSKRPKIFDCVYSPGVGLRLVWGARTR